MALSIKNKNVEELLNQITQITGESKTEAIRKALEERREKLMIQQTTRPDAARLLNFLADEIWSQIPENLLGTTLTKEEEEAILGFGEVGR